MMRAPLCRKGFFASVFILAFPFAIHISGGISKAETISLSLESGSYRIETDKQGLELIEMGGFRTAGSPGDPLLPQRSYNVLLPPDVVWESLRLNTIELEEETLPGTYDIAPAPPCRSWSRGKLIEDWGPARNISNGRNMDVYGADSFYPSVSLKLEPYSQMRKWKFTRIRFTPLQYNPVSKKLRLIKNLRLEITFSRSAVRRDSRLLSDRSREDLAPELFFNYASAQEWYPREQVRRDSPPADYVIITTDAIESNSARLSSFISHKEGRGHSVLTVTEADFNTLTGQAPNHRAEKIRQWLIDNWSGYGVEYVLLIGDPHPYESGEGDIPMKMCWPRLGAGSNERAPTDYFYADLTGNWDIDGDVYYYGTWSDYTNPGGVDLAAEVYVGRIPVYDADYTTLDNILQKIIEYENETDISWRSNVLLPMSFSDASTDGGALGEACKNDYLTERGYSCWRQYQQGSGPCSTDSDYTSEEELRGDTVVRDRWAAGDYGLVMWWGHGGSWSASVGYDGCWDGNLMYYTYTSSLDDDHPSFVYLCACSNGNPDWNINLAYSVLKQGGIGTVGASRVSWYSEGQTSFEGSPTNAGIGYGYMNRLTQALPAGEALYAAKLASVPNLPSHLMNHCDFNLYGDPSTSLLGKGMEMIYSFPLDSDPGWSAESDWAFGQPTGGGGAVGNPDPTSGYTGDYVYGYNLNGDYPNNLSPTRWLTMSSVDCSRLTNVHLRFRRWLNVENSKYDYAFIEVSSNGTDWIRVWTNNDTYWETDSSWLLKDHYISPCADWQNAVSIRWGMGPTDSSGSFSGWNIDDVEIWGIWHPTPSPTPTGTPVGYKTPSPSPTPSPTPSPPATPTPDPYCSAGGGCDEYISRVQFNTIDNSSECDGYGDYRSLSTVIRKGSSCGITVTNAVPYDDDACDVWVDWNRNWSFSDAGESVTLGGGPSVFSGTITAPMIAVLGETSLRIRLRYQESVEPCGTWTYGEVEDYTVIVAASVTPTSTPEGYKTPSPTGTPTPSPAPTSSPSPTAACCVRLDEGFDGYDTGTRPDGWSFINCDQNGDTYTAVGDFGHLSPSIKLDATGDIIETAHFGPAAWCQFWVKGQGTDASSHLLVEEYYGSGWSAVTDLYSLPSAGTVIGGLELLPVCDRLRFSYTRSTGAAAFDDVLVGCLIMPTPPPATPGITTTPPVITPTPEYCEPPLALNDISDARIGTTRSGSNYGYKYEVYAADEPASSNRWFYLYDRVNTYFDSSFSVPAYVKLGIYPDVDYGVQEGDWLDLTGLDWGNQTVNVRVYPPATDLPLDRWTYYYIAADGSTYNDRWLCDLAQAAPTSTPITPTPSPRPTATPTATPTLTPTPTATPGITPTPRMITPTPTTAPTVIPVKTPTPLPTVQPTVPPTPQTTPQTTPPPPAGKPPKMDFDGDGTSDIGIFRPPAGMWAIREVTRTYFGAAADLIVPNDYDGDGTTDIGIFRTATGLWAVRGVTRAYFGFSSDLPVPGDYDGDGDADIGIFRTASGLWAVRGVTRAYFGGSTDEPIPGDYDGDGAKEIGIFRVASGLWAIKGITRVYFGSAADEAMTGDFDGNGTWEIGIFRPASGLWAIRGVTRTYFGSSADNPLAADYAGNGRDDMGIFRETSGLWAIKGVTRAYFGSESDVPLTR